jgi:hypothetical protein
MDKNQIASFLGEVFQQDPAVFMDKPDELLNEAVEAVNEFSEIAAELGIDLENDHIPKAQEEQTTEPEPDDGLGMGEEQNAGFIPETE